MAAGLPVVASDVARSPSWSSSEGLVPAGDAGALAAAIARRAGDRAAGERGRERVRALCAPERSSPAALARMYDGGEAHAPTA